MGVGLVSNPVILTADSLQKTNEKFQVQPANQATQQSEKVQNATRSIWSRIDDAAKKVRSTIGAAKGFANGAYKVAKWSVLAAAAYGAYSYFDVPNLEIPQNFAAAYTTAQSVYHATGIALNQGVSAGGALAAAGSLTHAVVQVVGAIVLETQNGLNLLMTNDTIAPVNKITSAGRGYTAIATASVIGGAGTALKKLVIEPSLVAFPRAQSVATRGVGYSTVAATSLAILAPRAFETIANRIIYGIERTGDAYVWAKRGISSSWDAVEGTTTYEKTATLAKSAFNFIAKAVNSVHAFLFQNTSSTANAPFMFECPNNRTMYTNNLRLR